MKRNLAVAIAALAFLGPGCVQGVALEGKACDGSHPCVEGYRCTAEGLCVVDQASEGEGEGEGERAPRCPESIDDAIGACVGDLQADPELAAGNFLLDLLLMCADAEPVADDFDAHCAGDPADPTCALDYETFITEFLPECTERARAQLFADVCVLPATYRELATAPALSVVARRTVDSAASLEDWERDQLLLTSSETGFDAATVAEALAATDDGSYEQLTLLDVGTDRTLVAWTAHHGDTRVGRIYFRGTRVVVAIISDSDLSGCAVERTVEGQPCESQASCGDGHGCIGFVDDGAGATLGAGVCTEVAPLEGQGEACAVDADCASPGLLCLPGVAGTSTCRPGWMRHAFTADADGRDLVMGQTISLPIVAHGLAARLGRVRLDLTVGQSHANALVVRLRTPGGSGVVVSDTTVAPGTDLILVDQVVAPMVGLDANGVWGLEIEDVGGMAMGAVYAVTLSLDTEP